MKIPSKIRSKKLGTKVDLTAMVSVSFLLIIFFMVTIELSKPKKMMLNLPGDYCDFGSGCGWMGGCGENRSTTLLLGNDDKIICYTGLLEYPVSSPKIYTYGKKGIRTELFNKNKQDLEYSTAKGIQARGIIVIIKPSKKCNFKNLVDVLDEMAINNIQTYAIVNDFSPEEQKLLDAAKI